MCIYIERCLLQKSFDIRGPCQDFTHFVILWAMCTAWLSKCLLKGEWLNVTQRAHAVVQAPAIGFTILGADVKTSRPEDKKWNPDSAELREGVFQEQIHYW